MNLYVLMKSIVHSTDHLALCEEMRGLSKTCSQPFQRVTKKSHVQDGVYFCDGTLFQPPCLLSVNNNGRYVLTSRNDSPLLDAEYTTPSYFFGELWSARQFVLERDRQQITDFEERVKDASEQTKAIVQKQGYHIHSHLHPLYSNRLEAVKSYFNARYVELIGSWLDDDILLFATTEEHKKGYALCLPHATYFYHGWNSILLVMVHLYDAIEDHVDTQKALSHANDSKPIEIGTILANAMYECSHTHFYEVTHLDTPNSGQMQTGKMQAIMFDKKFQPIRGKYIGAPLDICLYTGADGVVIFNGLAGTRHALNVLDVYGTHPNHHPAVA